MAKDFGQVDPSVRVPAAVKAAAARADAIHQSSYNTSSPEEGQNNDNQDGNSGDQLDMFGNSGGEDNQNNQDQRNPEENNASGEGTEEGQETQGSQDSRQDYQKSNDSQRDRDQRQNQRENVTDSEWENRYKAMKGRYERAENTVRQLTDRLGSLEQVIATLEVRSAGTTEEDTSASKRQTLVTPEEIETYGTDYIDFARRLAKEEVSAEMEDLKRTVNVLSSRLNGVNGYVEQNARSQMLGQLDRDLSNWREINGNQDFLSWLALPDPFSGVIRHDMLRSAFERNDTPRVLAFFNGFLAEEAALAPAEHGNGNNGREVTSQGNNLRSTPKIPLASLAAPGRARPAAGSNPPVEKPVITRASIAKFYADVASGKYRGRDADKNRYENSIFAAEREGRIT
jgi:hypothetical protein